MADVKTTLDNIKAYWDFEESSSGAGAVTRYDLGPVGQNLTDNNTVTSSSSPTKIGNCAKFTCANSEYLSVADSADNDIDDGWSVSMWLYLDSTQVGGAGDYQYIISKRSGENGIQHYVQNDAGTWYIYMGTGTGAFSSTKVNVAISTNTWYHVVFYHNGASSKCYINGSSNNVSCNAITTNSASLLIGGATDTTAWAGYMDEVIITNDEITSSEVTSLYASGNGLPYYDPTDVKNDATLSTSLVSYFKMEQSAGATATDSHGSNSMADNGTVPKGTGILLEGADYDGSADYHEDASPSGLPYGDGARSYSLWVKYGSVPGVDTANALCDIGDVGVNQSFDFELVNLGGTTTLGLENNGARYTSTSFTPSTGVWYHFVLTYSGSVGTLRFYKNGVALGTASPSAFATGNNVKLRVGKRINASSYTDGIIDEVAFYGKALTVAEVRALYGYGTPPEYEVTASSSIKTINGLALASVKTVNGLAIASVKTVNGLA